MALLLTRSDVGDLLDLPTAIDLTEAVFREQAEGQVVAMPPRHLNTPKGPLRIVGGALVGSQRMGLRFGAAGTYHVQGERMVAVLYDTESGELLSIMALPFGRLRTGATVGLATRLLARQDARVVGMIGTGNNALSLLRGVSLVRPVEHIRVYSRSAEHRADFARRAEAELGKPVQPAETAEQATQGADVVCVATDALKPVLRAEWVSPGALVASMGRPGEIDPSVYLAADRIVVTHKEHEEGFGDVGQYTHQLLELVKTGRIDWQNSVHEMGDVIVGRAPGRTSPGQTIVFKESQGGFGDIAFAARIYAEAVSRGRGQPIDL